MPEKGVHYLLEAWKNLRTEKKLVIAGGSSDTQDCMDQLRVLAGDGVIFTGFQQGVRVPKWIPPLVIVHNERPPEFLMFQGARRFCFSDFSSYPSSNATLLIGNYA